MAFWLFETLPDSWTKHIWHIWNGSNEYHWKWLTERAYEPNTPHVYRVLKYVYEEGNRNNQIKNKNPGNEINETILLVPYFLYKFSKDISSL